MPDAPIPDRNCLSRNRKKAPLLLWYHVGMAPADGVSATRPAHGTNGGVLLHYPYGNTETDWLKSRDQLLGAAIERIGPIERSVMPDLFSSVLHSIIGQQISTQAHATIWNRLTERIQPLDAASVCRWMPEEIQSFGMTHRKAAYILDFARSVRDGRLDLDRIRQLPDADVVTQLTAIHGIGVWTAEMILIFCLQRPDIVSYGDLGILRGMRKLYGLEKIDRATFARITERYSPHGTVASLYLWAISSGALPDLADPAESAIPVVPAVQRRKNDKQPSETVLTTCPKTLTEDEMWHVVTTNDPAYDGRFFYAVRSTGIFCRPSCASKRPRRENVCYFDTASHAREAGYRPCKRCRSDLVAFDPDRELAHRARQILDVSFRDRASIDPALQALGVSRRRLATVFKASYGITLSEHMNARRLAEAEERLSNPEQTLADIAFASGFESLSSFYRFFKARRGMTPAAYRKARST